MAVAGEAAVTVVIRARDETAGALQKVQQNTQRMDMSFRTAISSVASFGSAAAGLAVGMGILGASTSGLISKVLLFTSATVAALPAIMMLINLLRQLNVIQRITIALQVTLNAVLGAGGLASIFSKLGAAGLLAKLGPAGLVAGVGLASYFGTRYVMGKIEGGSKPTPAPATVNINAGALMGNEAEARRFARQIQDSIREEQRLGR